jgi:hypothetical protein
MNVTEQKETGRVEAFSDGVFAIAITLLVLDLKFPGNGEHGDLPAELSRQWPAFVAFLNSFVTILIIWMNHHNLFNNIRRTNNVFMLVNGRPSYCDDPSLSNVARGEYFGHPVKTSQLHKCRNILCDGLLIQFPLAMHPINTD